MCSGPRCPCVRTSKNERLFNARPEGYFKRKQITNANVDALSNARRNIIQNRSQNQQQSHQQSQQPQMSSQIEQDHQDISFSGPPEISQKERLEHIYQLIEALPNLKLKNLKFVVKPSQNILQSMNALLTFFSGVDASVSDDLVREKEVPWSHSKKYCEDPQSFKQLLHSFAYLHENKLIGDKNIQVAQKHLDKLNQIQDEEYLNFVIPSQDPLGQQLKEIAQAFLDYCESFPQNDQRQNKEPNAVQTPPQTNHKQSQQHQTKQNHQQAKNQASYQSEPSQKQSQFNLLSEESKQNSHEGSQQAQNTNNYDEEEPEIYSEHESDEQPRRELVPQTQIEKQINDADLRKSDKANSKKNSDQQDNYVFSTPKKNNHKSQNSTHIKPQDEQETAKRHQQLVQNQQSVTKLDVNKQPTAQKRNNYQKQIPNTSRVEASIDTDDIQRLKREIKKRYEMIAKTKSQENVLEWSMRREAKQEFSQYESGKIKSHLQWNSEQLKKQQKVDEEQKRQKKQCELDDKEFKAILKSKKNKRFNSETYLNEKYQRYLQTYASKYDENISQQEDLTLYISSLKSELKFADQEKNSVEYHFDDFCKRVNSGKSPFKI